MRQASGRVGGHDRERNQLKDVLAREQTFIYTNTPEKIQAEVANLHRIEWGTIFLASKFLQGMFEYLADKRTSIKRPDSGHSAF